ncbi:hypothetical protein FKW77_007500 [Venturia effusa]|uniref:Uncharacterized protein n=1 Tax=Venturia effusa TaxID=50376 RepID=A0A517L9K1_9PEZI|nr:hypothetical protein FKW77_007500 [Venturia effusa]
MAWEFLRPILTPNALATVQANPILLAYLLGWTFAILFVIGVAVAINIQTSKMYAKPKKAGEKTGPSPGLGEKFEGAMKGLRAKLSCFAITSNSSFSSGSNPGTAPLLAIADSMKSEVTSSRSQVSE